MADEDADRTVTQSDPHSYYCAECRTHYEFPWGRASDCTCARIQEFVAAHRESHTADTNRVQVNAPVNIRSAEKLGLVDENGIYEARKKCGYE